MARTRKALEYQQIFLFLARCYNVIFNDGDTQKAADEHADKQCQFKTNQ
jgi:hypothetical protein